MNNLALPVGSESVGAMNEAVVSYFTGEKYGGLLLIGVGAAAIAVAVVLLQPRWGLRSFAIPLAVVALLEIALGIGLYLRTGPQVSELLAQLGSDAPGFVTDESARMARVQRNFIVVQFIEVAIIVVAALVALTQKDRFWIAAVALAFLCHAAFLLVFDIVAERRGAEYLAWIEEGHRTHVPRDSH